MNHLKAFARYLRQNLITTVLGVIVLGQTGQKVWQQPELLDQTDTLTKIAGGLALVTGQDPKKVQDVLAARTLGR